jgi:hypothetical protein
MVLSDPVPLLTPPHSSSPPKTPFRSYSAQIPRMKRRTRSPPTTTPRDFCFSVLLLGATGRERVLFIGTQFSILYTGRERVLFIGTQLSNFLSEGSQRGGLLFRFCLSLCFSVSQGWINFFSLPDGLCHLFGDHNPSSILICCVIYDLEVRNDANPQDANFDPCW